MKNRFILLLTVALVCCMNASAQETQIQYLSGKGSDSAVEWDFYCTAGRGSGVWTKIPVPSNWECQGFGQYTYGHMPLEERLDESGLYRYEFKVPHSWKGKNVDIVFGAAMTDTRVRINGKSAGPIHQGGYYEFRYDISGLLRFGKENVLEVEVDKSSSDESLVRAERKADFWVFGGIFRPVWLEAKPKLNIGNFAIDAGSDGAIKVRAELSKAARGCKVVANVRTLDGARVGSPFETPVHDGSSVEFASVIDGISPWSAEFPALYELELELMKDSEIIHRISERFGFRTVEVRPSDGIYVNGVKIKLKGVNRHSFWPTSGRALNDDINLKDALLIKDMNMNAVRCSHYPPDRRFLDICDSLGLYVIDELLGWQDACDTEVGRKIAREMVVRDRNHPSILLWANGNEGGSNFELDKYFKEYDLQKRHVFHPWLEEDVLNTFHYPSWNSVKDYLAGGRKVWMPTEFNHGLYDGGHGAGLEDFWSIMQASPLCAGGFLWDFVDQAVLRDDSGGIYDTDRHHGADGILGPYRQKEGSFYAIKDIWSPVQLGGTSFLSPFFDGVLPVENRYSFTNLSQCRFDAVLTKYDFIRNTSSEVALQVESPDVAPGRCGELRICVPKDLKDYDALEISVTGADGRHICTWVRTISTASEVAGKILDSDKTSCTELPVKGIRFIGNAGDDSRLDIRILPSGWTEVKFDFARRGNFVNVGVTFDFPEEKVTGMRWLGNGPYRVWKNRLRGVGFGLWEKEYNDAVTGECWEYPEFKGYHSNMYAADIMTKDGVLRIVFASDDLFLRLFTPSKPEGRNNDNTLGEFPDGQISVLTAISPVGTKFKKPEGLGPQGQKNYIEYNAEKRTTHSKGRFYMKYIPN